MTMEMIEIIKAIVFGLGGGLVIFLFAALVVKAMYKTGFLDWLYK